MSDHDLERRLRDGLQGPTATPEPMILLRDVRRGARRRSRRQVAAVGAAVAAVVGALAVVTQWGGPTETLNPSGPSPTSVAPTTATDPNRDGRLARTVGVAASDRSFFRVTSNLGCQACSAVWTRRPGGQWSLLREFGAEAYRGRIDAGYGPLDTVTASPDGRHLWLSGESLWSSHDAGATWARVGDGPGRPSARFYRVTAGASHVLAVAFSAGRPEVWTSPVDADRWTRVNGDEITPSESDGRVLQVAGRPAILVESAPRWRLLVTDDGSSFDSLEMPCDGFTRPSALGDVLVVACPETDEARPPVVVWRSVGLGPWERAGEVESLYQAAAAAYALGPDTILVAGENREDDVLLTSQGQVATGVPLFFGLAVVGDEVLVTAMRPEQVSSNGGRTWVTPDE